MIPERFQFGDAIQNNRLNDVRVFLEAGMSPHQRVFAVDNHGNEILTTPLGLAWKSIEMIQLLISYGADIDFVFEVMYNPEVADKFFEVGTFDN